MKTIVLSDEQYKLMMDRLKDSHAEYGGESVYDLIEHIEGTEPKPEKPVDERCECCKCYFPTPDRTTFGTCRLFPPSPYIRTGSYAVIRSEAFFQQTVRFDCWCGQFKQKQKEGV